MKWSVLVSCVHAQRYMNHFREFLQEHHMEIAVPIVEQHLSEAELLTMIGRFDGILAGDDELTARVLSHAVRLKVISKWGIGVDAIDMSAAQQFHIKVFNTPDVFGDEVADVVMGYIILLSRRLHQLNHVVRAGEWPKIEGTSLRHKTLGVIGLGNIGQNVSRRALVSGMNVIAYDIAPPHRFLEQNPQVLAVDLNVLLSESDFISLNCNLTPQNRRLLDDIAFSKMKDGVYLINTARGALIDEAALVHALENKKVGGAALDVFEDEPLASSSPLRRFDNCIFGSHNSSNTKEAVIRVTEMALMNLLKGLQE